MIFRSGVLEMLPVCSNFFPVWSHGNLKRTRAADLDYYLFEVEFGNNARKKCNFMNYVDQVIVHWKYFGAIVWRSKPISITDVEIAKQILCDFDIILSVIWERNYRKVRKNNHHWATDRQFKWILVEEWKVSWSQKTSSFCWFKTNTSICTSRQIRQLRAWKKYVIYERFGTKLSFCESKRVWLAELKVTVDSI